MKNKKLLIGLITLCLCLCVLIPLGLRLMWCKVTFVCKDGCEHIVWYKWGESANADIVRDAHKDEYPGYVVGPLYMYDELLVNYLGEPLRTPYRTLYVDEWKKPNTFYKVTFDTPYGTLFYLLDYTGLEELQERIPAALVALGGKKNAEYIGRIEKVLVDGASRSKEGTYEGRTDGFKLVNFTGGPGLEGQIVNVKITDSNTFSLTGEVV